MSASLLLKSGPSSGPGRTPWAVRPFHLCTRPRSSSPRSLFFYAPFLAGRKNLAGFQKLLETFRKSNYWRVSGMSFDEFPMNFVWTQKQSVFARPQNSFEIHPRTFRKLSRMSFQEVSSSFWKPSR